MVNADEMMLERPFAQARSQSDWCADPVSDEQLRDAYKVAKWGPTSMNTQPMRIAFLRTSAAKELLRPALAPTNVEKVMAAPVVALICHDMRFYEHLPRTFAHNPGARDRFASDPAVAEATAFRNGTLQAAYFMLALRAVGLDVGPMSGFDAAKVDAQFFADGS